MELELELGLDVDGGDGGVGGLVGQPDTNTANISTAGSLPREAARDLSGHELRYGGSATIFIVLGSIRLQVIAHQEMIKLRCHAGARRMLHRRHKRQWNNGAYDSRMAAGSRTDGS